MKINVIGLGKLGLPLAAVLNQKFDVYGMDTDEVRVACIELRNPVDEPQVNDLLKKPLEVGTDYRPADINFICVPTPSVNGSFSNEFVDKALEVVKGLAVIVSTVMPGTCKKRGVIYNPSFIALGSVVKNLTNPDFILLGRDNVQVDQLLDVWLTLYPKIPIKIMTTYEAEICKIALNCYITMKITFANHLQEICDIDVSRVLKTLGLDSRIGSKYLRAGLGYGGPCFPRDNKAFQAFAKSLGKWAELAETVDKINNQQVHKVVSKIVDLRPKSVGFESLSYKQGSNVQEESQLLKIYENLKEMGYKVKMGEGDITLNHWGIIEKEEEKTKIDR